MPDSPLTLVGFLEGRIKAREAWARVILGGDTARSVELRGLAAVAVDECAALRVVLAEHEPAPKSSPFGMHDFGCFKCHLDHGEIDGGGWCETLRLLAWPHRSRPGYDPAWAPADTPTIPDKPVRT